MRVLIVRWSCSPSTTDVVRPAPIILVSNLNLNPSDQIACGENVHGIDCMLDTAQNVYAGLADAILHEFLAELANAMMMTDAAAILHNLFASAILDLAVDAHWVRQTGIHEPEVDVHSSTGIIDLHRPWGVPELLGMR